MSDRADFSCSKMDPLLAKSEPLSDAGSTSGILYLRKGKKRCTTAGGREEGGDGREKLCRHQGHIP